MLCVLVRCFSSVLLLLLVWFVIWLMCVFMGRGEFWVMVIMVKCLLICRVCI